MGGDAESFGVFYRRFSEAVLVFFARRTRQPELAVDLMAETFAAALLALGRGDSAPDEPGAWLLTIARNKLIDSRRRGRVADEARRRLQLDPLMVDDDELARVMDGAADAPRALGLLEHLPQDQRTALVARVLDEREYGDIARELRCSEAVVRKRVSRGLRKLRAELEETA